MASSSRFRGTSFRPFSVSRSSSRSPGIPTAGEHTVPVSRSAFSRKTILRSGFATLERQTQRGSKFTRRLSIVSQQATSKAQLTRPSRHRSISMIRRGVVVVSRVRDWIRAADIGAEYHRTNHYRRDRTSCAGNELTSRCLVLDSRNREGDFGMENRIEIASETRSYNFRTEKRCDCFRFRLSKRAFPRSTRILWYSLGRS